jgi:hypothetical protein
VLGGPMGASQLPLSERETPVLAPDSPTSGGFRVRPHLRRQFFLGRADLAPAMVALVAVGYTVFALLQGSVSAPHRSGSGRSVGSSGLAVPTAKSSESSRVTPVAGGGGTRPGGSGGPSVAGGVGPSRSPAASHSEMPVTSPHLTPVADHTAGGDSAHGVLTPESWAPTSTATARSSASARNGSANSVTAGTLSAGSAVSLRVTTPCCTASYIRHQGNMVVTSVVTSSSSNSSKNDASWVVRRGLANSSCISFESKYYPGNYLRHSSFHIYRQPVDGTALFRADATFCPTAGKNGTGTSFASYNYPTRFLRHYNNMLYIASNGGSSAWDSSLYWADDVSWAVTFPWAP